jgi:hypothetical protein
VLLFAEQQGNTAFFYFISRLCYYFVRNRYSQVHKCDTTMEYVQ